jgi:hypothetical protein
LSTIPMALTKANAAMMGTTRAIVLAGLFIVLN